MKRVWFNHWFSTSYGIIQLLKEDKEIIVVGSNREINSVIQNVCDEWYLDSNESGDAYVDFCLDFCKQHLIDAFVPRRNMVDISRRKEDFAAIGVRVLVDDYDVVRLLNDKAETYRYFADIDGVKIPDYFVVNNAKEFETAYRNLRLNYEQICVKFVRDEGGLSYRRIAENMNAYKRIRMYSGAEIEYNDYRNALSEVDSFDDLIVMPYLPGEEISVDCLKTEDGLIAIPRIKGSARHEHIKYDANILKMSEKLVTKANLICPCNVQFKVRDGIPYLLEINTRMSGGLQMSCLASGINIPLIALKQLFGEKANWEKKDVEKIVSYIEMPQIINPNY